MIAARWLLLGCLLWQLPAVQARPLLALVIDDLGNDLAAGQAVLALPGQLTFSFLPGTPHARGLSRAAFASGRESMLHLPMGPLGIAADSSAARIHGTLNQALHAVPFAAGVNNHMGSRLTREPRPMQWLMESLRLHGGLYFVDSRTHPDTVAEFTAREIGIPTTRRDVFLDNQRNEAAIRRQFRELLTRAREQGAALGIAHPYPETLRVLRSELATLDAAGVELVPVSQFIDWQRRQRQWHASSSP